MENKNFDEGIRDVRGLMENPATLEKKEDSSLVGMIASFERIINNPVVRRALRHSTEYCEKDGASRLEVALELYVGKRKDACLQCRLTEKVISYVFKRASASFGFSDEQAKKALSNAYWRRGVASTIKGLALFGVRRPFVPGAPYQVVWNITKACNFACLHCYESAGRRADDEATPEMVLQGIEKLARAGVTSIAFSGGEPTLLPHMVDYVRRANELGMYVAMATNGWVFANRNAVRKYREAGLQFVQISLDGPDPEVHDSFRRVKGSWERAVQAIRNCKEEGMFVEVSMTVTKYNLKDVPRMIELVRQLGANWLMIYNFVPTGRGREIITEDLEPQQRYELLRMLYENTGKNGSTELLSTAPQYAMVAQVVEAQKHLGKNIVPTHFSNPQYSNPKLKNLADFIGGCGAGRFYVSIEPNGDIYPCVFFPHDEEVRIGNLFKDDFEKLWVNNPVLEKLRNKDILEGYCGRCPYRYTCGGCRARAYNYYHDILAPDPGCILNQKEWEKLKMDLMIRAGAEELPSGALALKIS
ncbi:MAG: radical SAM protein [Nitrososphaeria archaeon]